MTPARLGASTAAPYAGDVTTVDLTDATKLRTAIAELRGFLAAGLTDEQARYEMGLSFGEYDDVKEALYAQEKLSISEKAADPHRVFIDYSIAQSACLSDVDALLSKMEDSKQYSAAVGAVRLASEIHDKIVRMGQDLGVLVKRPDEKRVTLITGSIEEMRAMVAKETKAIEAMMRAAGEADIIDVEPGPSHRALPPATLAAEITPLSTAPKVARHAGRRMVKDGPPSPS